MSSAIDLEYNAYADFASGAMASVISFARRSTSNNVEASDNHLENQALRNQACIEETLGVGSSVVKMHYTQPKSGFASYSNSYAKRLVAEIKKHPKGSRITVVVSSLGRLSREYRVIKKMQEKLAEYTVFIQFSQQRFEKSILGVDHKVVRLSDVNQEHLSRYKDEVSERQNRYQQERVALAVDLMNLGYSVKSACIATNTWIGSIKAYQEKNKYRHNVLRGKNDSRIKRSRKVLELGARLDVSREEIARLTGYTLRNVYKILQKHREALAELARVRGVERVATQQEALNGSEKPSSKVSKSVGIWIKEGVVLRVAEKQYEAIKRYLRL